MKYSIEERSFGKTCWFTPCYSFKEGGWKTVDGAPTFTKKEEAEDWLMEYLAPRPEPKITYHEFNPLRS